MNTCKHSIEDIVREFRIYGDFIEAVPFGTGHINDTYRAKFNQGGVKLYYTIQRINHNVFKNPPQVMENIERVSNHLMKKYSASGNGSRRTLQVVKTWDNKAYFKDDDGNFWRAYIFVSGARTFDVLENSNQAYQAARAFGNFQKELVDIPGGRLNETIVDFHNTPKRLAALEEAIAQDVCGRVKDVQAEIKFILDRKADASKLVDLLAAGKIPERITHNDTKLNNVLIDDETGEGICVIDLDTIMPGLAHYDFGDMVRTGTSPSAEDEKDLSKVYMQFEMFEALLRGYMETAGDVLNPLEIELLPFAGKLITMEIGIRFLTDYLQGDVYFKVHREGHNLDRCRTQLKLVASIEEQMEEMVKLLHSLRK
ncbi:MAG: aminoglycoside phosphotransferase family protein [Lentisphaeria bacterium]|nr:aminoglycoside phosphotransferase family protein [Lentisphaeria bacterium]